ncbi:MAG: DUF732 domain-containing protein [Pseudonocardia sp.]|nr:DUF732 domain-containing protein [Pseudonocardia sp.]
MKKLALAVGAGAFAAAGALIAAPHAAADPQTDVLAYMALLNAHGIVVSDLPAAVGVGYAVCNAVATGGLNGEQVATALYARFPAQIPSMTAARVIVISAVDALCPQFDHRGEQFS